MWLRSHSESHSLRKAEGNENFYAPLEKTNISLGHSILVSCYKPFRAYAVHIFPGQTQLNMPQKSSLTGCFS